LSAWADGEVNSLFYHRMSVPHRREQSLHIRVEVKVEEFFVHASDGAKRAIREAASFTILVSEGAMVRVLDDGKFWRNHIRVLLIDIQRKSKR